MSEEQPSDTRPNSPCQGEFDSPKGNHHDRGHDRPLHRRRRALRRFRDHSEPQPVYRGLDLDTGRLFADYNAVIANAVPVGVFYGFERRYGIPVLTAKAANELME
ncbi:hypothetical protein ACIRQF_00070 [Streptomyces sp. NPDC101191]|uniref:hypothetical protein n=1 Tax=Streptomyces sp. NPDC101191 TaxID=3366126 RepID=UPI00381322CB